MNSGVVSAAETWSLFVIALLPALLITAFARLRLNKDDW
jgi:hypothetical protein